MGRILQILRKFGGATLLDALPTKTEFEEHLQKTALIVNNLDARLRALDIDIAISARRTGSSIDNKHN